MQHVLIAAEQPAPCKLGIGNDTFSVSDWYQYWKCRPSTDTWYRYRPNSIAKWLSRVMQKYADVVVRTVFMH